MGIEDSEELHGQALTDADKVATQLLDNPDLGPDAVLGVAFSGGVDSAVLTALAARALGPDRVVALLAVSPSLARVERDLAHRVAQQIGVRLVELDTDELADPDYVANGVDRCYFCKSELFTVIDRDHAQELGLAAVAYGENADDRTHHDRPGSRAADEHHVLRPLASAGISKANVREIARQLGLEVADKPAAPCLASRIPHGEPVTRHKLQQIDCAEQVVRLAGFSDCRVRHHGTIARVELPLAEISRLADPQLREQLQQGIAAAGFEHVTIDLAGLQSGAFTLKILSQRPDNAR